MTRYKIAGLLVTLCVLSFATDRSIMAAADEQPKPSRAKQSAEKSSRHMPNNVPTRVQRSDCIFVGRVKTIEKAPIKADGVDYTIALLEVKEMLLGPKGMTEVCLAFNQQETARFRDGQVFTLAVGQEGCFFLEKHPKEDFYLREFENLPLLKNSGTYAKDLVLTRRLVQPLHDPLISLKAKVAADRLLAAHVLVNRYRLRKTGNVKPEPIDTEESRLILKTLAEADWADSEKVDLETGFSLIQTFGRLNLTAQDGWNAPKLPPRPNPENMKQFFEQRAAAAHAWLKEQADRYRIQRFVPVNE